jgi:hypothetical protein
MVVATEGNHTQNISVKRLPRKSPIRKKQMNSSMLWLEIGGQHPLMLVTVRYVSLLQNSRST